MVNVGVRQPRIDMTDCASHLADPLPAPTDRAVRRAARGPFRTEVWLSARQRSGVRLAAHYFRAADVLAVLIIGLAVAWAAAPNGLGALTVSLIAPGLAAGVVILGLMRGLNLYGFRRRRRPLAHLASIVGLSLAAAGFAVLIAVPLAYMLAWRKRRWTPILNFAAEMPYALPGVVLAIACLLMFLKPLPVVGVSLYNTLWIILFAYLARFFVLALRPTVAGLHQIDRALEEAARVAGAGLFYRLRTIIFPLVAPATLAGGVLIFMTAFCELTVSALLWASGSETLGVVMFSFEQAGDSAYAAAISILAVAVTFMLMLATNLFARRLPNGVLPWRD